MNPTYVSVPYWVHASLLDIKGPKTKQFNRGIRDEYDLCEFYFQARQVLVEILSSHDGNTQPSLFQQLFTSRSKH
jgi:hypothetical protein